MFIIKKERNECEISVGTCVDTDTRKEVICELEYKIYDDNRYLIHETKKYIISNTFFDKLEKGAKTLEVSQAIKNSDSFDIAIFLDFITRGVFQLKTFQQVVCEIVAMLKKYNVKRIWFSDPFHTKIAFIETASFLECSISESDIKTIFGKASEY